jgi:short-subunit dehydrogenase
MEKKNIFITGAASGIGRETALYFAKEGWFVGITDVNEKLLLTLEKEIGKSNCYLSPMDVTNINSVQNVIDEFSKQTGGHIDLLFNNAGVIKFGMFENIALSDVHRIVDINLKGILNCTHYALKYLKKASNARIVNMASTSAIYGIPDLAVYSATKRAICALTEALDIELEKYNITVCDILVPFTNTPLLDVDEKIYVIEKMGINIEPEVVAKTVWRASQKKKLHWKIGTPTYVLMGLFWLVPGIKRTIVKYLTIAPD